MEAFAFTCFLFAGLLYLAFVAAILSLAAIVAIFVLSGVAVVTLWKKGHPALAIGVAGMLVLLLL